MGDTSYQTKVYHEQGGDRFVAADGGSIDVESGGELDVESGGALKIDGTAISASAAELNTNSGVTAGTVKASSTVVVDSSKNIGDFLNLDCTNLDAGASGTAGSVDVFPSTASKGKLAITCADQTGNTTVSLTAAEMSAARTITLQDPGAAANVVQSTGTQAAAIPLTDTEIAERSVSAILTDISTTDNAFVVCPWAGTITKIWNVIDGAIATGDNAMTTSIAGTAITSGNFTVAHSGSAAGDVDSATPSATNTVTAGQALSVTTPGSSTNTVKSVTTFVIQMS